MTSRHRVVLTLALVGLAAAPLLAQSSGTTPDAPSAASTTKPDARGDPKSPPPIFAKLSFNEALAKATRENKLLIIKFTAEWCGPCKQMDRTTWRDQSVFDWAYDNAIVIAVDVDKETKVSEQHKIRAMPTMVAYRDGVEFDRTVGGMNASKTLAWMKDVKDGKSTAAAARERAKTTEGKSVRDRMDDVRTLLDNEDYAAAQPLLIDLWKNMAEDDPATVGVRRSFFAGDIERAAAAHAPTRDAFITIRDQNEASLKSAPDYETLMDWIVLNRSLGQTDKTLEWFDRVKTTDNGLVTINRLAFLIEPLIKARGSIRDFSTITPNPINQIRASIIDAKRADTMAAQNPDRASYSTFVWTNTREHAGLLHAALILDARADVAALYRDEAIKLDDTPAMRIALVEAATMHIPQGDPNRVSIRDWALPMLDQAQAALKDAPDANLSTRAAAARKAFAN